MVGQIDSIETMGLVDGPGIRIVIFMQGCKLRCIFCHNPETWSLKGKISMTPEEVVKFVLRYKNYFQNNGGVTFSGGEPLLQPEFLIETLKLCKGNNIHTCIDTAGIGIGNYEEILKYTDLVLLDIKAVEKNKYKEITGVDKLDEFFKFVDICKKMDKKLWIRQVIVPGINDSEEYIYKLKDFIKEHFNINNIEKVELLPYHTLGVDKYKKLGIPYKLDGVPEMNKEECNELQKIINNI